MYNQTFIVLVELFVIRTSNHDISMLLCSVLSRATLGATWAYVSNSGPGSKRTMDGGTVYYYYYYYGGFYYLTNDWPLASTPLAPVPLPSPSSVPTAHHNEAF
jgi:hypothetical protein